LTRAICLSGALLCEHWINGAIVEDRPPLAIAYQARS
jgi:hypothetical protein